MIHIFTIHQITVSVIQIFVSPPCNIVLIKEVCVVGGCGGERHIALHSCCFLLYQWSSVDVPCSKTLEE